MTAALGRGPVPLPEPDASLTESAFAAVDLDCFLIDLRASPAPPPEAARWLARPLRMRCIAPGYDPARDTDFHVDAGPLADCVDRIVHVRRVDPTTFISPP